jgi:hypothetical protein
MRKYRLFLMVLVTITALMGVSFYSKADSTPTGEQESESFPLANRLRPRSSGAFVRYELNGKAVCRSATPQEVVEMKERSPEVRLRTISPIRPNQTGLKIMLRGTQQLEGFPDAKAAFLRAAATWEALIQTPITIVLDVDFGPTRFGRPYGALVLGSTDTQDLGADGIYTDIRGALVAGASSDQERTLYNSLPTGSVLTDVGSTSGMFSASALLRALNLISPTANPTTELANFGPPPSIGFNSSFSYDFDPSNGIDVNRIDFDAVAVHEIGHALGFTSATGTLELLPNEDLTVTVWDLFRFRPGTTLSTFNSARRIQTSGGTQVFFIGGSDVQLSTGRPNGQGGDGRQASHWKDDDLIGQFIGIMDPVIGPGDREVITQNDLMALDSFGYKITGMVQQDTTPPTVSVTAPGGGQSITGGTQFNITWTSSDNVAVTRHIVELSTDGGSTFPTSIASGLAGNARSFLWSVPNIDVPTARIRVTAVDTANNQGSNTGAGNFSIVKDNTPPDFRLATSPGAQTVTPGASTSFTLISQSFGGFSQPVNLSAVVSPADSNITASLSASTITPGTSTSLTVNTTSSAPAGTFTITITGTSGQVVRTAAATVNVLQGDFSLSIAPAAQNAAPGQSVSFTLNAQVTGNFPQPINLSTSFTSPDANGKIIPTLSSATITPGGAATLTVSVDPATASGSFGVIITATSGQIVRTATATVNVVAPDFSLAFNPASVTVARKQKGLFTVNIARTGNFSGNVTVTAPDTKAFKIKLTQTSLSTTGTSVSFNFKIKPTAASGTRQLTFSGRDDTGRVRTGTLTVVIQ